MYLKGGANMYHLRELRIQKGLTQAELSKALQVSASSIGMYEQGRREPDNETLGRIANFFNVTTDYLLGRTDEPGGFQKGDGGNEAVAEKEVKTVKPKAYVELHRLIDELPHSDVEELLNTAIFKKKKAEQVHEHVDDPDDF